MRARPLLLVLVGCAVAAPAPSAQTLRFDELHRMLPRDRFSAYGVLAGDVDGDADLDLLFALNGADRLHLNVGDARFVDASAGVPLEADTAAAAFGDVDGDGDLDLVRAIPGMQQALALGDGSGAFVSAPFPVGEFLFTFDMALGDADADGDLDAVFAGLPFFGYGGRTQLYVNDGTGGFADASTQIPPDLDDTYSLAMADLDGDGDLDLLLGNGQSGSGFKRRYANQGDGTFLDASAGLPADTEHTVDIAVADVDADGDLDVFLANAPFDDSSKLWANDGAGGFADASGGLPTGLPGLDCAAFLDVDGDHDLDLVLGGDHLSANAGEPHLLLGDGAGAFADASAPLPEALRINGIAGGDLDADGDVDLALGCPSRGVLWLGNGHGAFGAADWDVAAENEPGGLLLGDVDGDGFVDALLGRCAPDTGSNFLFLGGTEGVGGWFVAAHDRMPASDGNVLSGALGDFDGDGDLDVYWGAAQQDRLELNDGAATFTDATDHLPALTLWTRTVDVGDLDGDGDLDVCIGRMPTNPTAPTDGDNLVLANDGSGSFAVAAGALPPVYEFTVDVALADVDGDGDLDAFVGNGGAPFYPGKDRLYENDGTGTFSEDTGALPYPGADRATPVFADFDGDGDVELFLGGRNAPAPDLFLQNDGTGVFSVAGAALPATALGTVDAAAGDVDEDGALDLFVTDGERALVFRGDGAGAFVDGPAALPALANTFRQLALVDLDGDEDLDAWLAGDGVDARWSNLARQLAWRALPRVGKELVLDVWGPAFGPWMVAHSTATAFVSLPPFGTLYLDPTHLPLLGFGMLDGEGRASLSLAIPATPALVGVKVYAQAAVGPVPRLANAEIAGFTDL